MPLVALAGCALEVEPLGSRPEQLTNPPPLVARDDSPTTYQTLALLANEAADVLGDESIRAPIPNTLLPRAPHEKPVAPLGCPDLAGAPNVLDLKFVEGTAIRRNATAGLFYSLVNLSPQHTADLAAVNAKALPLEPGFERPPAELLADKAAGELHTGETLADLTLWYAGMLGTYLDDVAADPGACASMALTINELNALSIVELAEQGGDETPSGIASLPPPEDLSPTADLPQARYLEPDVGLNAPETLPAYDGTRLQLAYQGARTAVVVVEGRRPSHEKFNRTNLGGSSCNDEGVDHAAAVMSLAFGAHRHLLLDSGRRYGNRSAAPRSPGAIHAACRAAGNWQDNARAMDSASSEMVFGDVLSVSRGRRGGTLLSSGKNRDAAENLTANGRFLFMAAGNGARFHNWTHSRRAAIVGGTQSSDGSSRWVDSSFGPRVDFNAHAENVWAARSTGTPANRLYSWFGGTSAATPIVASVGASIASTFEELFGRPLAVPELYATMRSASDLFVADLGARPNSRRTHERFVTATRFRADGARWLGLPAWNALAPHRDTMLLFGGTLSGLTFRAAAGGQPAHWESTVAEPHGMRAFEISASRGPLDVNDDGVLGFTVEAWVRIGTIGTAFQTLLAKEQPRNYGLFVGPSWHASAGRLHFAFDPDGPVSNCETNGTARVDDGAWHHVAARYRWSAGAPRISLWIDGVRDGAEVLACRSEPPVFQGGAGEDQLRVGDFLATGNDIASFGIHHRALTDAEIGLRGGSEPAGGVP